MASNHLLQSSRICYHCEGHLGNFGDHTRRISPEHPAIEQPLGFGPCTIVAGNGMAGIKQSLSHTAPHSPKTNETKISHKYPPITIGSMPPARTRRWALTHSPGYPIRAAQPP